MRLRLFRQVNPSLTGSAGLGSVPAPMINSVETFRSVERFDQTMEMTMNTFSKIGLAAAAFTGVALATAPASAQEWRGYDRDHGRYDRGWDRDRDHDWGRREWRGDRRRYGYGYSYHRPYYAWRDGCATYWRWDAWRQRNVRVTRCY